MKSSLFLSHGCSSEGLCQRLACLKSRLHSGFCMPVRTHLSPFGFQVGKPISKRLISDDVDTALPQPCRHITEGQSKSVAKCRRVHFERGRTPSTLLILAPSSARSQGGSIPTMQSGLAQPPSQRRQVCDQKVRRFDRLLTPLPLTNTDPCHLWRVQQPPGLGQTPGRCKGRFVRFSRVFHQNCHVVDHRADTEKRHP